MKYVSCLTHELLRDGGRNSKTLPNSKSINIERQKIFFKRLLRTQYFKEMAPNIPLPPQPVMTRWGI